MEYFLSQYAFHSSASLFARVIGHFLQCLDFLLNFPQHFSLTFLREHPPLQSEQAALRANSVIEILAAKMFDFSMPQ